MKKQKTYVFQFCDERCTFSIDSELITLDKAKILWEENYPKAVEFINKGIGVQMYIWSNMDEGFAFDLNNVYAKIDNDYVVIGGLIHPPFTTPIPKIL